MSYRGENCHCTKTAAITTGSAEHMQAGSITDSRARDAKDAAPAWLQRANLAFVMLRAGACKLTSAGLRCRMWPIVAWCS